MATSAPKSPDWACDAVFYHIYPLGLCGAPRRNDFAAAPVPRLERLVDWVDYLRRLGVTALYLGPLFESSAHGYDTADYYKLDRRLGTNDTMRTVVDAMHAGGIRVVLDGVFHHVGRDFRAFRNLQLNGERSPYSDWFAGIDFAKRSPYGDPFAYDGWHGHYDLVKLNLSNADVREHLFGAVEEWVSQFGIDGLRLDVAEVIDPHFLRALSAFCRGLRADFWLLGEAIHGDYARLTGPDMLHSVTNYECYKGLYSCHNDRNYHEIAYSLNRQFGQAGIYRDLSLYNFADNHDVDRVASMLSDPAHLNPLYLLLFTMPGIPSVYAGSEWGVEGVKGSGDDGPLRPELDWRRADRHGVHPELAKAIRRLAAVRHGSKALRRGSYKQLYVAMEQLAFTRESGDDYLVVAANGETSLVSLEVPATDGAAFDDLLEPGRSFEVHGGRLRIDVPACWGRILARR